MKENLILVDFDGTIILSDLSAYFVEKYASKEWRYFEEQFFQKKINIEEAVVAQYSLIKAPKDEILREIENIVKIRNNFVQFVNFCFDRGLKINIVSGGMDFIIRHVLESIGFLNHIEINAIVTEHHENGSIKAKKPSKYFKDSADFKQDLVRYYKNQNYNVIYIGDGSSDYEAVLKADKIFSVSGSDLSKHCRNNNLSYTEFDDFREIIDYF